MSVTENQEQLALSLHTQASIYVQEGKTEDAIGAYKEVISLKPDWAEAYRNLAKVLGNIGELKESANYWYQAFNLEPTWPIASDYLALGNMLVEVQQLEDAEICYRHAIALNPHAVEPYHNLGEVFTYQRKFDEAIDFYHQALKINPDYSSCYLGLGKAFAQKSEWENAIASFRKSISLTPDAPQVYHHLGNILDKIGKKEEALSCYRKALEINPESWDVYQRLGEFFAQQLKLEEAVDAYRKALEINPQAYFSHHQLGQTLFKMKRWEDAVTCARRAIELYPNTPWCYTQLGNNLIELGKEEDAMVCHRKAAALRGWTPCEERGYEFTRDWFSHNIPIWQKYLEHFANISGLNIVEIGSFQGMSTCWLLDNILTAPDAKITCIEPGFQPQFDPNIDKTGAADKVIKLAAFSQDVLGDLETEAFDLAYIDGCHLAESVLQDAILSWRVVKVGGLIIFDDYEWYDPESLLMITKMGVDIFLEMFKNRVEVLHQGYQLIIKKIAPDVPNNALQIDQNQLISAQAYQALADALKQQGDVDGAIEHYQKAVELGNTQVENYETLGKLLQNKGNFKDAIIAYEKVLDFKPNAGDIAYSLGEMSFYLERWEDAVNYYRLALTLNSNVTEIYPNLGNALLNLKRWEEAIISYRHGIDHQQDFFWVYHHIGEAFLNLEKWQDAGDAFSHALEKNPENSWSYSGLGTAFLKQEKWQDAVTAYQKANQLNPSVFDSYFSLGDALTKLEKWDDAVIAYERAAELNPDFSWCYQSLGDAFTKQQKWEDAARAYQSAIALNPDFFGSYYNLGEALFHLKKWDDAITSYQKVIELKPDFSLPYSRLEEIASLSQIQEINSNSFLKAFDLGTTLLAQEKWEDAVNAYGDAIAINPNNSWAYYYLGDALSKLSQWENAIIAYRQAIRLNPDFFGGYHQLGDALSKLENYAEARDAYRHAIALNSDLAWSYHNLGIALSKLEQWEDAIIAYREAIKLEPEMKWFYENLGEALRKLERWDEAIIAYSRSLELDPHPLWVYDILIELLQKQGRIDDEIDIYKKMIEIVPNRCAYYDELGQLLMQKEQWEDAITTFVKALQIQPDYSLAIYDNIAKALEKLGFDDDAYGCYLNKQLSDYVIQIYCQLSDDLLTTSQTHPSLTHIDIYPANLLDLSPSKKISDSALSETQTPTEQSLLSVGVDGKIGWDLMTTAIAPETFVVVVPEGRAWGDAVTSAIITTDNKLVINVSTKGNAELIISSDKLIPPELINGTVAFLSVKWGGLGYFHWMLDLIARIHLLYQSGFTLDKIDKFVVNSYDKPYQKETLTLLGIPPEKIIDSSHCHHIKAQTLVVPSLQFQGIYKLCNWACDFLKESFLNEQVTPNTRIYISREAPYPRKISNNDEVSQYLETLGFEKVLLETMSVGEQALCLASAEIVVAPHGAGLTNLVFCHPGTKVIEIFSPLYMPPEYWLLSNVCGLEHFSCIGELLDKHASCYDVYQDIFVNLEQLQELLTMAGIVNG
ncbi:MAG: hypothetical protein RLZZ338_4496 [Cyanobacteriota bacterium]|jgi:tetratricopeptide (TPR) repeat protein